MNKVPKSLRIWFMIHFFADIIFAIPLIFAPKWILGILGAQTVDIFSARIIGAALFGIGTVSLIKNNGGIETYDALLTLKILWGWSAAFGIIISYDYWPKFGALILLTFIVFPSVWLYYKIALRKS